MDIVRGGHLGRDPGAAQRRGGENIYPAEVENVLREHPAVADCGVIGVPDARWGEVGQAVVVLQPEARASEADLLGFLDGKVARFQGPEVGTVHRHAAADRHRQDPQEGAAGNPGGRLSRLAAVARAVARGRARVLHTAPGMRR